MIESRRAHAIEAAQVIHVRGQVAAPGHDIERRVVGFGFPQAPLGFHDDLEAAGAILIGGHGSQEVVGIGEAIGAYGAQLRQAEKRAVVFANVAARGAVGQVHGELEAAGDEGDGTGARFQYPEFGTQAQASQHFGIAQSRVSDLLRGKWEKFSLDMLITLAARAGQKVELAMHA